MTNYQTLCPVCLTPCTDRYEDKCSGCGSTRYPIFVHTSLVRVVKLLIKLGVSVIDTNSRLCTTHKTKITIYLDSNIPEHLFDDLPSGWQIIQSNRLYCDDIDRYKMISDLESWAISKDTI